MCRNMKSLYLYIKEEGECASINATPGNTMGMGNPMPAGVNGEVGSEPLVNTRTKKYKKEKKTKEKIN